MTTRRAEASYGVDLAQPNPARLAQFWRYVAERQRIYYARLSGVPRPWSTDRVFRRFHFTCPFRAADRTSQFVIRRVIYNPAFSADPRDVFLRVNLFRCFNRPGTWSYILASYGEPRADNFREIAPAILRALAAHRVAYGREQGEILYGPAWQPARLEGNDPTIGARAPVLFGRIADALDRGVVGDVVGAATWSALFDVIGGVYHTTNRDALRYVATLSRQIAIDLAYAGLAELDENDYSEAWHRIGDAVERVYDRAGQDRPESVVFDMVRTQDAALTAVGIDPAAVRLFGRALTAVDISQALREFLRYSRATDGEAVSHVYAGNQPRPLADVKGVYFPPQWRINERVPPQWRAADTEYRK